MLQIESVELSMPADLHLIGVLSLHCYTSAKEEVRSIKSATLNKLKIMLYNIAKSLREANHHRLSVFNLFKDVSCLEGIFVPATKYQDLIF